MPRTGDGIALRGTTYWLDFRFQGHRHIVRLGSKISRHVAKEIAAVHRVRIQQGAVGIGKR